MALPAVRMVHAKSMVRIFHGARSGGGYSISDSTTCKSGTPVTTFEECNKAVAAVGHIRNPHATRMPVDGTYTNYPACFLYDNGKKDESAADSASGVRKLAFAGD